MAAVRHWRFLIAAALCASIAGCTLVVTANDIAGLRRGMEPGQIVPTLGRKPKAEFIGKSMHSGDSVRIFLYAFRRMGSKDYFLVLKNDSLAFWGYPEECRGLKDTILSAFSLKVSAKLQNDVLQQKRFWFF